MPNPGYAQISHVTSAGFVSLSGFQKNKNYSFNILSTKFKQSLKSTLNCRSTMEVTFSEVPAAK